jgi:uncharacterized protein
MHSVIANHRDEIATLCRRYGVRRREAFGSAARGVDFDPATSDADFLVEFADRSAFDPLEQFFGFASALEVALGRPVDLIEMRAIRNPYVMASVEADRETVYEA